jgi:hypothetical protein
MTIIGSFRTIARKRHRDTWVFHGRAEGREKSVADGYAYPRKRFLSEHTALLPEASRPCHA